MCPELLGREPWFQMLFTPTGKATDFRVVPNFKVMLIVIDWSFSIMILLPLKVWVTLSGNLNKGLTIFKLLEILVASVALVGS